MLQRYAPVDNNPQLAEAWADLHYYRLAASSKTTSKDLTQAIEKLRTKWPHLPTRLPRESAEIKKGQDTALSKLKAARLAAKELREKYLQRKADLYIALEERGKAKAVQRLIRAETQHQVYTKIGYLRRQNLEPTGVSTIKIPRNGQITNSDQMKAMPDPAEYWETITIPEEIERVLLERNRHHFCQAEGTPFASLPLKAAIGYKADGYAAELMLEGTFRASQIPAATSLFIQHLQTKTTQTLEGRITKDKVRNKLK